VYQPRPGANDRNAARLDPRLFAVEVRFCCFWASRRRSSFFDGEDDEFSRVAAAKSVRPKQDKHHETAVRQAAIGNVASGEIDETAVVYQPSTARQKAEQ